MKNLEIETIINSFYVEGGAHGQEHAEEVVALVDEIAQEPEYTGKLSLEALLITKVAAAFHDAGYEGRMEYWSGTQWEHPIESARIMYKYLQEKHPGEITPGQLATIAMLILNHDEAGHRMPAYHRFELELYGMKPGIATSPRFGPGMIATPPRPFPGIGYEMFKELDFAEEIEKYPFQIMLQILREADGRLGSAERTMKFSLSRGVPAVSKDGDRPGVGLHAWQYTSIANVQLAARRAALDAYTQTGRDKAWEIIEAANQFCLRVLAENGLSDAQSNFCPVERADLEKHLWQENGRNQCYLGTWITQAIPITGLSAVLENPFTAPRADYEYSSLIVQIDQIKTEKKESKQVVAMLEELRRRLLANYAFDFLTELPGMARVMSDFSGHEIEYSLVPPIVVFDQEEGKYKVEDVMGGNWIALAKKLGKTHIRVLMKKVTRVS